jgi:hypothetical protein
LPKGFLFEVFVVVDFVFVTVEVDVVVRAGGCGAVWAAVKAAESRTAEMKASLVIVAFQEKGRRPGDRISLHLFKHGAERRVPRANIDWGTPSQTG